MIARKFGTFSIPMQLIEDDPATARLALEGCIVVRAEAIYAKGCIDYMAIHEDFEEVPLDEFAPEYVGVITGGRREWKRK